MTVTRNRALGEFLRARRQDADPVRLGMGGSPRRRVTGLRREELAKLAGVSTDYYARLEQGRQLTASAQVLDSLADVLTLSDAERAHLHNLASGRNREGNSLPIQIVRPGTRRLLASLGSTPAIVLGRRTDVLASNAAARAVVGDFTTMAPRERNAARRLLLDKAAARLHADWEEIARGMVGLLCLHAGRHPDDPKLQELIEDLATHSALFRRLWAEQHVVAELQVTKILHHPIAGRLELAVESLAIPSDPDQLIHILVPEPSSQSDYALRALMDPAQRQIRPA